MMTPKSLLRHKRCVSTFEEMGPGSFFHRLLWDDAEYNPQEGEIKLASDSKIRRVVICSGKIYYELFEEREKLGVNDVYLLRVEQLYPYPGSAMAVELGRFKKAEMVWAQEESKNMGAFSFIEPFIEQTLEEIGAKHSRARYIGRKASASPATGIPSKHKAEQQAILDAAFEG
jgi:2-oxoglutarate dehydrogenase E1 component